MCHVGIRNLTKIQEKDEIKIWDTQTKINETNVIKIQDTQPRK